MESVRTMEVKENNNKASSVRMPCSMEDIVLKDLVQ